MDIKEKFEKGRESHTYQRVDTDHSVNVYLGYNDSGNMSMVVAENGKEERVKSSKFIDVQLKRREDQKLALSFDLQDSAYAQLFTIFCKDMIVVCERAGKEMAISNALIRWKYWLELFGKKSPHILDRNEIKGLVGELLFLKDYMAPQFELDEAVKSWMGPMLGHKDFEIQNTWYETKSINAGAVQVAISSLEQLESEEDGHLAILRLEETSENNDQSINLNRLVLQIMEMIETPEIRDMFMVRLDNIGYANDPEYEKYAYVKRGMEIYKVDDSFPRIRRNSINPSIGNAKYTIMIDGLVNYREI